MGGIDTLTLWQVFLTDEDGDILYRITAGGPTMSLYQRFLGFEIRMRKPSLNHITITLQEQQFHHHAHLSTQPHSTHDVVIINSNCRLRQATSL